MVLMIEMAFSPPKPPQFQNCSVTLITLSGFVHLGRTSSAFVELYATLLKTAEKLRGIETYMVFINSPERNEQSNPTFKQATAALMTQKVSQGVSTITASDFDSCVAQTVPTTSEVKDVFGGQWPATDGDQ